MTLARRGPDTKTPISEPPTIAKALIWIPGKGVFSITLLVASQKGGLLFWIVNRHLQDRLPPRFQMLFVAALDFAANYLCFLAFMLNYVPFSFALHAHKRHV